MTRAQVRALIFVLTAKRIRFKYVGGQIRFDTTFNNLVRTALGA